MRVVARGEGEQADLVVAGGLVALERSLDESLDRAIPQRALDDRALAEPALPGTAAHDLDGDPVVSRLNERNDRPGRQGDPLQVSDHAGLDLLRHVVARPA